MCSKCGFQLPIQMQTFISKFGKPHSIWNLHYCSRYQAICYPLSNCTWTPKRSKIMIGSAWLIALLLCIPQAVIFELKTYEDGGSHCSANFVEGWGQKAYVTWFSFSNFFFPLVILLFCYGRICHAIWDNFNNKRTGTDGEPKTRRFIKLR